VGGTWRCATTLSWWQAERAEEAVAQLIHIAEIVDPAEVIADIEADPADNRVLEVAATGNVAAIVSGDRHLLGLGVWRGIPIQAPAAFVAESE
jgi:predicted nucleic acid-binding protein